MQNDFEKQLQQELENLALTPNKDVWQNVELRIRKDKQRKKAFIIWFSTAIILLAGGFFIYKNISSINPPTSYSAKTQHTENTVVRNSYKENNASEKIDIDLHKKKTEEAYYPKRVENKKNSSDFKKRNSAIEVDNHKDPNKGKEINKLNSSSNLKLNNKVAANSLNIIKKNETIALNNNNRITSSEPIIKDEIQNHLNIPNAGEKVLEIKLFDSSFITEVDTVISPAKKVEQKHNKWRLGLNVYAGFSDNKNGGKPNLIAFQQNASPGVGSSFSSANSKISYSNALSLGVGLFTETRISRRLSASIGFDYHYFAAGSKTGTPIDTAATLFDASRNSSTAITRYYRAGNSNSFTNQYHLLQVPLNVVWQVNKNLNKPIAGIFGIAPSFMVASRGLYVNNTGLIYTDKEQYNQFGVFLQSGVLFPVYKNIQVGPIAKYGITDITKPSVNSNQHLLFFGINSKIFFK